MFSALQDVADFHKACDIPMLSSPGIPDRDRVELRISLIEEEVNKELIAALHRVRQVSDVIRNSDVDTVVNWKTKSLVEIADGIADSIYVLIGTALEFGIPLDDVWDKVQESNMDKVDPATGKVRKREDGKVLKPEGWKPPDIAEVITRASTRFRKW